MTLPASGYFLVAVSQISSGSLECELGEKKYIFDVSNFCSLFCLSHTSVLYRVQNQ